MSQHSDSRDLKDQWLYISITYIITMKKFEIMQEWQKHDTKTWNELMLLESGADRLDTELPQSFNL